MTFSRVRILALSAIISLTPATSFAATLYNTTPAAAPEPSVNTAAPVSTTAVPAPAAVTSPAAPATGAAQPSGQALAFGKQAGAACPGKWDSAPCLSIISNSNLALAANYGEALQQKGLNADAEQIKQHCAAATAAREQAFPAYAMKSAFIECANLIADTSSKTGVQPDLSLYQMLVGATMCMDNDPRCSGITEQLKALAAK